MLTFQTFFYALLMVLKLYSRSYEILSPKPETGKTTAPTPLIATKGEDKQNMVHGNR